MSLLSATLESTADGILVVGIDGKIAGINEQFTTMWGIPDELMATGDDAAVIDYVLGLLSNPAGFVDKVNELYAHPTAESHDVLDFLDGRTFERYSRPQRVGNAVVGRVWSFRDVTPRRRAQEQARQAMAELAEQAAQLKAMAFQDPLTGLANRKLFHDQLTEALHGKDGTAVDVLLLDLDDFKEVNDILGHHAGDQMLVEVARRLRPASGRRTPWPGWAAMSSWCSSPGPPTPKPWRKTLCSRSTFRYGSRDPCCGPA